MVDELVGSKAYVATGNPRAAALDAIKSALGNAPKAIFHTGRFMRFSVEGDKHNQTAGWAVYYEFTLKDKTIGLCVFGNWRTDERHTWSSKRYEYMTKEEKFTYNERLDHVKDLLKAEQDEKNKNAAQQAKRIWGQLQRLENHEYLDKKQIKPYMARILNDKIVLPVYHNEEMVSLQYINADGSKRFLPGGKMSGGYCLIEGNGDTYVTEGYATGATIAELTGANVYICFTAGNLYDVVDHAVKNGTGEIIIAADNDRNTEGNPGKTKGQVASDAHGVRMIYPMFEHEDGTDFNDLAVFEGKDRALKQLKHKPKAAKVAQKEKTIDVCAPPGAMGDIFRFYNATSGNYTPSMATQTAIAVASILTSRYFMTDKGNTSSLYFVNIAKSGVGKEHCKTIIERVLKSCDMGKLIGGDGFTSSTAVLSTLVLRPKVIVVLDEFGRNLEAACAPGNSMLREANTALMEATARTTGTLRPKNYASLNLTKEQAEAMLDRYVEWPAPTLVGLTTPSTFFGNIRTTDVLDGFLGRFVIDVCDAERALRRDTAPMDVPDAVKEWAEEIVQRYKAVNIEDNAKVAPDPIMVNYSEEAYAEQRKFEQWCIDMQNKHEETGLGGVVARSNEQSMRLALICALACDPKATTIYPDHVKWATEYIKSKAVRLLESFKDSVSHNAYEADKKEILEAIKLSGGISLSRMRTQAPFSKHKDRDLKEILESLVDGEKIEVMSDKTKKRGRPTALYVCID